MSSLAPQSGGFGGRLPAWLAPRRASGGRRTWLIETITLVAIGVVLATAAIDDIFYTVHTAGREVADMTTWRHYTHHDYYNISVGPLVLGKTTDVACGNTVPGAPGERTQICLVVVGPVDQGVRSVLGGWYLPAQTGDFLDKRYGCFGAVVADGLCPK